MKVHSSAKILLATDLSARCDRALDRAASLAVNWDARLLALHVIEPADSLSSGSGGTPLPSWRRPPDAIRIAERQLRADMTEGGDRMEAMVEQGDPVECILRVAQAHSCGLIVTGVSRNEVFGRKLAGTTVDRLIRRSNVPVLIVRKRVRGSYRNLVVASDFSEPSRHAAEVAARLFPDVLLTLFHAYDAPFARHVTDQERYRREYGEAAAEEAAEFMETLDLPKLARSRMRVMIESGMPAGLLGEYTKESDIDVVALGTRGRSGIMSVLIGSIALGILADLDCDALVVRAS